MKFRSNKPGVLELPEVYIDNLRAGVDWLTITTKSKDARDALANECFRLKSLLDANGERFRPWAFKGYTGFSIAGLRWGTRLDSDIAMLSGIDAHQNWYICGEWAEHCSRIDLAVTVNCNKSFPQLVDTYYDYANQPGKRNVKYKTAITKNSDGGRTFYVGSRTSRAFGRVYDKGIEAGLAPEVGKLWRYEIEFKKPLSQQVLKGMLANKYLPVGVHWEEEIAQSIASTVYVWFQARNIPPLFTRRENLAMSLEVEARVTSDEVSLNWLTTQVRPTVMRLASRGKLQRVKESLGLTDQIQDHLDK